ncbi:MAG: hypothetical protein A2Y65_01260 [Deltaproteobacteria bacterium RBG_13_52_11]|nr:MAG: hypothetical protein A2Y65_01260 [Deltaproteobacteria bacterium RBG_13_52_11]
MSKALTPKEVVTLYPSLTRSEGSLANWRHFLRGPKFFKVGRKIVYRQEDIEEFLFSNPVLTIDSHPGGNGRGHTERVLNSVEAEVREGIAKK